MKTQTNSEKVLDIFLDDPLEKFHLREIARMTGLNPNTVLNITGKLVDEGLLLKEKKRHIVEFSANFDNKEFRIFKKIRNLFKVYGSGVVEFLNDKFDAEAIVLIGSYSRGEDIGESDIDIVVISKKDYNGLNLNNFEKRLGRKIHPIIVYYNKISNEFYTNLINGIILEGYVKRK
jgi:predicted nucleotidyltransferase